MNNSETTLELTNLGIGYSSNFLFSGINLKIAAGELVCVIGQNGIGKSTFLRTLCGFQKPLSGSVKLFGKEIGEHSFHELSLQMSVVQTSKIESRMMRVIELLRIARYPHTNWLGRITESDQQKIDEALRVVEIVHLADRPLYSLSDGELQKVMIAKALVQETPVIILDEPTSHLDLKNKAELLALLFTLTREHQRTIIVATHEIELAMQLSDKIILMSSNQFFFYGTPHEVVEEKMLSQLFIDADELISYDEVTSKFVFNLRRHSNS